jgi:threonine 3-dehydrogenase
MSLLMRALVKAEAKAGLTLSHIPIPEIGPDEALIRIKKTAICGTDVHIWKWDSWAQRTIPIPMQVGHEYVGEIVKLGTSVTGYQVGERVSGEGHIVCGNCRNCRAGKRHLCPKTIGVGVNRPGAFAEYLALPAANLFKVPDDISDHIAAIFDPLGNAVHTSLSFDLVGEDVLITGAGPIGCMAASVCKFVGARHVVVTDVNPWRLEMASRMGATRVVNTKLEKLQTVMRELGMSEGFDVGLEMSGNGDALRCMLDAMVNGGKVAILGIFPDDVSIDWSKVVFKGLEIKGIYGRQMFETWYKMSALVRSGLNLDPIITHCMPVRDFELGFTHMLSGRSGKVILEW